MAQNYQQQEKETDTAAHAENTLGFLQNQEAYDIYLVHDSKINYFGAGANYEDEKW